MRLVQDLIFLDQVDFVIPLVEAHRCQYTTGSWGECATEAAALVGLELVDYNSTVFRPQPNGMMLVQLRSKAWRDRVERFSAQRRNRSDGFY